MHPTFHYDLMQARQQDRLRSAAQRSLAAQARTARLAHRDHRAAAPRQRVLHLVWRLLPS